MKNLFLALLLGVPLYVSADEVNTAVVGETADTMLMARVLCISGITAEAKHQQKSIKQQQFISHIRSVPPVK